MTKLVAVLSIFSLLGMSALLITSPTTVAASPSPDIGRVTVSGTDILVDGVKPDEPFFGVCDTTALAFAIENYINGNHGVAGWTSVFNGPDTGARMPVTPNDTPDAFWNQYFAQMASYDVNLVRIGPHDQWGSGLSYNAWADHREQFFDLLHSMAYYAQYHGVWLSFCIAGAQEYPTFDYRGSGTVFDPNSQAFANYLAFAKDIMVELEDWDSIAMYDMFNEPDHDKIHAAYWGSDKVRFNTWANAIADATAGVSTHPRNMGVAGFGQMFGMNQADFNLVTGDTGFEILHRHYYGSNTDPYNFEAPEQWAREKGKPLLWGELAYNGVYPLVRYEFGEQAIWNAGGQAITAMVLTGTDGYPYSGGVSSDAPVPRPAYNGKSLEFVSTPIAEATVGHTYEYEVKTSRPATLSLTSDAPFLELDEANGTVSGVPTVPGDYEVSIAATADEGTVYQRYTLSVQANTSGSPVQISATDLGDNTFTLHYTTDLSITGVTEARWDLGDGNTSTESAPVHKYANGSYDVALTIVDDEGKVFNTSRMLVVGADASGQLPYVPTAGMIGAGASQLTVVVAALLFGTAIGLLGYVVLKKRDML
ncbi:MAG: hypothetical protein GX307_06760 [Euryarchaeota archaeon]|nr:hypothetical protein [Euryarchaeota archaeon]